MNGVGLTPDEAGVDFEQFFLRSSDLMVVAGADGVFQVVNAAWRDVLGWELEELRSQPFMSFVHPDDVEETSAQFERQALGESAIEFENRYRCRDGSYRWLQWNASPLDEVVYAIARDVTARKALEVALRESEARARSVLDTAMSGIVVIDAEGLVVAVNLAAERIFGYASDEVVGRNVKMLMPEPYHSEHDGYLARYLETGERRIIGIGREVEGRRRDGTTFPLELAVSEVESGVRRLFTGVVRDITERVAAAAAVEEARAAAERASNAKSDFLSHMSHELRTPLNAVLGFAQLLELDDATDAQRESIAQILRAGRHPLDLINDVLNLSRIETGRLALSNEPVLVLTGIHEAVELVEGMATEHAVTLSVETGCDAHVYADRQRLKQVLVNLLTNAIKYNLPDGSVTVTCEQADGQLLIHVVDTGRGIASDRLELLFQPFERLGAEQSDIEGTGIGLALAKGLTEAMGGTLRAASRVGIGTTFTIALSVVDEPLAAAAEHQDIEPAQHALRLSTAPPRTVLYIEDNFSNLRVVEHLLARRPSITLLSATHGLEGLERAREHRPDLVLLDLHLPDLDGHDALLRLHGDPVTADIPVVIVSADATPRQIRRLLAAGARDYLTKPLDIARVLALIDEILFTPRTLPNTPE
jgi:PAS domain S-box-containing protein